MTRIAKFLTISAVPWALAMVLVALPGDSPVSTTVSAAGPHGSLDQQLRATLQAAGFTGRIETYFKRRLKQTLGRPIDPRLANLGRLLWFDTLHSLGADNTCGGCHSPTNGMGDSQPMAIGVQSPLVEGKFVVGPDRTGPRNQRRSPTVVNTALYPRMMWNSRFESLSGDPFDPSQGFRFPEPEGDVRFSAAANAAHDLRHLLQAQAHMPPTELIEVAGFKGACDQDDLQELFCQFDFEGAPGVTLPLPEPPPPAGSGVRNERIRQMALNTLNANAEYRRLFGQVFTEIRKGAPIDFFHFGKAIAEFEFTLVFADAPLDQFARGHHKAMTKSEKRGALLFFDKGCASCHRVDGNSNEMFSDFQEHVVGVPQIFPIFGRPTGNFPFAGPGKNEDFGREERTGNIADRYRFRTAPLRNLAVSPGFFHNGAFVTMEDAIRFHLDVISSAALYKPDDANVPADLRQYPLAVVDPDLVDAELQDPISLTNEEIADLVSFVRDALTDDRVGRKTLCKLIPATLPGGRPLAFEFQGCPAP